VNAAARKARAQLAANIRWANCGDRTAATQAARDAARDVYLRRVDPDGQMDPADRAKKAASLRAADMARARLAKFNKTN